MEKGIQQGNEENGQEKQEKTYSETDAVIVKTPLNTVNVVVESENVEVDTNEMYKIENGQDFVIDSEDREVQEDDGIMENQGRRIISTLTSKHYAAHVRLFKEWLKGKGISEVFEEWEPKVISDRLSEFYKESHLKHGGTKRVSSLKIIRAAIDHHLRSAPYCKSYSLTHSPAFIKANTTLVHLEASQRELLDSSESNSGSLLLTVDDIHKLWATGVVGIKTPKSLQHLVFLGIGINFGIISRENLRDLKPSMFEFHIDENSGLEYASCSLWDSVSTQLKRNKSKCTGRKMFSVPGSLQCPVAALKLFLKRRNPACSAFFQIPNNSEFELSGQWYKAQPAGLNALSRMMKDMSRQALLSKEYTNHNLRSTPPIVLYKAMEDVPYLKLPRIIPQADLNNKVALNSPGTTVLSSVTTLLMNTQPVNADRSYTLSPPGDSNPVETASNHMATVSNIGNPTGNTTNIPQNAHQVYCISEQWNMKDIIRAIDAGDAVVITKQLKKRELQTHENGETTCLRDNQQQGRVASQSFGRDRSGRKQPEPKRFCRDPKIVKEELTKDKIEDGLLKAINDMKTGLQSFEDLVTKQQPSEHVIQELSQISDCFQELLQRINTKGMIVQ